MILNTAIGIESDLHKLENQIQKASRELEKAECKIKSETVNGRTYCLTVGISLPTLIKRRNQGLINCVRIRSGYRYYLPVKGGSNG